MASLVFQTYRRILKLTMNEIHMIGADIPIPLFAPATIEQLCRESIEILKGEETVLAINGEFVIIGDLHGNLIDLVRILSIHGLPPHTNYLFLGDYVDRGQFSIEVATILLSLMTLFPKNVYLLKGNHEISNINSNYGFFQEVMRSYGFPLIWERINDVFQWLPMCAIINNSVFCVHGGISSRVSSRSDLLNIRRPIIELDDLCIDLLWSDPTNKTKKYKPSYRGKGKEFGISATKKFLSAVRCDRIIRAHQSIPTGVDTMFDGFVTTVFSTSNVFAKNVHGMCGSLIINRECILNKVVLNPIKPLMRIHCAFNNISDHKYKIEYNNLLSRNLSLAELEINEKHASLSSSEKVKNCSMYCFKRTTHPSALKVMMSQEKAGQAIRTPKKLSLPTITTASSLSIIPNMAHRLPILKQAIK
ncbi:Ser/Thr protein phosphatase [Tritrichomonas foetus]|uniref:Serine/threonine-protein phosphatase n=1 Tax=Tritrichomonas foetus TaxID=1144522 RepID=A0A1J4KS88_9EUKA|nr:Ser/Thr protein phosphatase [Tritrichomonas foetus]|eukprot:OHT12526.1 Ser/Thr protein phosphatase [Tritrichomonas foetus]